MSSRGFSNRQTTIDQEVVLKGIGVHSGAEVSLILHPAEANTGYNFYVQGGGQIGHVPGDFRAVSNLTLCTVLSASRWNIHRDRRAFAGRAARPERRQRGRSRLNSPEVPIMDGSAEPFVYPIQEAGANVARPAAISKCVRPIEIREATRLASCIPLGSFHGSTYRSTSSIHCFAGNVARCDVTKTSSLRKSCRARPSFLKDVESCGPIGRALGGSLENTVAIGETGMLNPNASAMTDEFVRHKTLDAVGDMALAGAPILGLYRSYRGSHHLNSKVLHALYEAKDAWTIVEVAEKPAHRYVAPRAEFGIAFAMPNFAPEMA